MKTVKRLKARELREEGWSIRKIATTLNVSKGSVSLWVRDIVLTDAQKEELISSKYQSGNGLKVWEIGSKANQKKCRNLRLAHQNKGRLKAKEADNDHQAMCMLYWAEGTKSRNSCSFANSDVDMLRYFLRMLKKYFSLKDSEISLKMHVHLDNGFDLEEIEKFWLKELDLPVSCLRKSYIDTRQRKSGKNSRKNVLYNGVCTIQIGRTDIVQHIYGAIQEYCKFENHKWLD